MTFLNLMTWYSLHYRFALANAKSLNQQKIILTSLTYLPHNPITMKFYNHGMGIYS
jgi:hypothetical protein